ncbi:MAG: hypothetical protein JXA25_06780 [Anaerolineales bacterium]|nr:hypothetical protein [Anaerolineales bacterium]
MPEINQVRLLQVVGGIFIALGFAARSGFYKKWYWSGRGGAYAYIPLGLMFILFTFHDWAEQTLSQPMYYGFLGLFGLFGIFCVWWTLKPPRFLQPRWVRWIEKHPRRVVQMMKSEVEAGEEWEEIIKSEEAIDQWAKVLRGKLPRHAKK